MGWFLLVSVVMVGSFNAINGLDNTICPKDFNLVAGKCYLFFQKPSTWLNAESICEEYGSALAVVKTEQQYIELLDHINANYGGRYWISGALIGGNWIWIPDGSFMNMAWFGRTPETSGNYCAYFCSFTRRYWDGECTLEKKFICQRNERPAHSDPETGVMIDPRTVRGVNEITNNLLR